MMKKNRAIILPLVFAICLVTSKVQAKPVVLDFDTYTGGNWRLNSRCRGISYVSGGILTIDTPNCHEFILPPPYDEWHQYVDNTRGWTIEAKIEVDPTTEPECYGRGSVLIWAYDYSILLIVGFSTDEICIAYPERVTYAMDTTDDFHVYRIEVQGFHIKVYADDALKIEHTLTWSGGGTPALIFGDGTANTKSLSYWDYFMYDVGDITPPVVEHTDPDEVTCQDPESGLAEIKVVAASNCTIDIPPFEAGTNDPVILTVTRVDRSEGSFFEVEVIDVAGNLTSFDAADDPVTGELKSSGNGSNGSFGCFIDTAAYGLFRVK